MPRTPMPALQLSLQFADNRHRDRLPRHWVARCLRTALQQPAQLTVRIVDAAEGLRLNRMFRDQDHATNVLTFPYDDGEHGPVQADLVLCAPVVAAEARRQRRPLEAHYAHLLVHGALHAQGYDHEHEADAALMEAAETAVLQRLGFPDPYRRR